MTKMTATATSAVCTDVSKQLRMMGRPCPITGKWAFVRHDGEVTRPVELALDGAHQDIAETEFNAWLSGGRTMDAHGLRIAQPDDVSRVLHWILVQAGK